jgi:DNA helicase HerA-like ATPase
VTQTPFEQTETFRVGTVDFVSPDEIKAALDIEAPESIALNAGAPRFFPRVNGYLLIPVDEGFLVGQISWLTVERSAFPKRRGMQDFGLVDLPYPLRRISLSPLGTLRASTEGAFRFHRGVEAFPSIGAAVRIPTEAQLRSIVESGERRRVKIGTSPLAADAEVSVDPNRLFGRHLAVLGNTGSGKSCSVAGLVRWSLEQARDAADGKKPNARFIVLDPNGEYARAFGKDSGFPKSRIFKVNPGDHEEALKIPLWFWNSAEWCSFTQASAKTQRPTLLHALRVVRDGETESAPDPSHAMRRFLRTVVSTIRIELNTGSPWGSFPKPKSFFEKLGKWKSGLEEELPSFAGSEATAMEELVNAIDGLCAPRRIQYAHMDFTLQEVTELLSVASAAHTAFGGSDSDIVAPDIDAPRPFDGSSLVKAVEASAEMLNVSDHVETLLLRLRALLNDTRMKPIIGDNEDVTLENWLTNHVGGESADEDCIVVIDLSLVPTEVTHVLTAVIARMVFEGLQRYIKLKAVALPTVLVMEEAHIFVKRYKDDVENQDAASVCCQVFERIAREGRKFGLGLVLSSQRPSELSPTVLSQCNTFLLHRISNDRDQELVQRLVPDNLKGLLRELPSLPSQSAILLGWASELPVLVKMKDLPKSQQPRSDDPEFWGVWIGKDEHGEPITRTADWAAVAKDWQDPA